MPPLSVRRRAGAAAIAKLRADHPGAAIGTKLQFNRQPALSIPRMQQIEPQSPRMNPGNSGGRAVAPANTRPRRNRRRLNRVPIIPTAAAGNQYHNAPAPSSPPAQPQRSSGGDENQNCPALTRGVFAFATSLPLANRRVGITRRQFEQMQQRVGGVSTRAALPVFESDLRPAANSHRVILGVDPSLRGTGYGVIRLARPHPVALAHGTISCPKGWERSRCLAKISKRFARSSARTSPDGLRHRRTFLRAKFANRDHHGRGARRGAGGHCRSGTGNL